MVLPKRRSLVSLLAIGILVAGCGDSDDPAGPGNVPSGSLRFTFSGAVSGQFNAEGSLQTTANNQATFGTWAAADRSPDNDLVVVGFQARTATRGDMFILGIEAATGTGTVQICEEATCRGEAGFFRGASQTGGGFETMCWLESGSINLQSISNDRARGTFSGTGTCVDEQFNEAPFTITNGSFDVPRIQAFNPGG